MPQVTTSEMLAIYHDTRDDFIERVRALSPDQAASSVPCCPEWSPTQVVAHVSGLVAEALANVPPPLGSDEATARQVGDRAAMSLDDVCSEWAGNAQPFADFTQENPAWIVPLAADLAVHVHDVAEAFSWDIDPSGAATVAAAYQYATRLQQRCAEQLDIALTVALTDGDTISPQAGSNPVELTASSYDFLRGVTGRRNRAHVAALGWSSDPAEIMDGPWIQYGVLRN